jgi:ferredoxin-NADP reductase
MALGTISTAPLKLGRRLLDTQFVEALVSPNPIERYIDIVDPTWSRRDVRAQVTEVRRQTARSATLTLKPNDNWKGFTAGQHVGVTVEIDGVLTTRFYSPACSAEARGGEIEITVTAHPKGKVSRFLVENARPGMVVGLSPAEGDFTLPALHPRNVLLISGGSGITPVMSILRTLCDQGHTGPITFIHYVRTPKDALYKDELARIADEHPNVNVVRAVTRGGAAKSGLNGHLTRKQLKSLCPDYAEAETYVCGPTALVDAAEKIWRKDGLAKQLHSERFVLSEPVVVAGDATGRIRFGKSDLAVHNDGRPLLTQAEDAGLSPRCGCRMGICHTCIAHVQNGSVRDVRTGAVRTVSDEYIQICVNAPIGDVEIDL